MITEAVIVALITALGQVFKKFVPNEYMPIISIVVGIAASIGFIDADLAEQLLYGVAFGLAASGLFDVAKIPAKVSDKKDTSTL